MRKGDLQRYVEPFVGGGAVFFDVMQKFKPRTAFISDINKDLILTYTVVQQRSTELIYFLEQLQNQYNKTESEKRQDLFLTVRQSFNEQRFAISYNKITDNWIPRAAQLIFLNKTCFNGLFRLNSKGEFNVPFGKYANPNICDKLNIKACSEILQNTDIRIANYEQSLEVIDSKSFVYFDPPYRPLSKTASFTTYSGTEFTDREQIRLALFFQKINDKTKAKMMLSNSDPKNENPNDNFFEHTFEKFNIHRVRASRAINSKGDKRGAINEILITNYEPQPQTLTLNL